MQQTVETSNEGQIHSAVTQTLQEPINSFAASSLKFGKHRVAITVFSSSY
jgi:hypothetical protein